MIPKDDTGIVTIRRYLFSASSLFYHGERPLGAWQSQKEFASVVSPPRKDIPTQTTGGRKEGPLCFFERVGE